MVPKDKRESELKSSISLSNNRKLGEREFAVDDTPTFTEFLGYIYFCGATIAGPFFEYKDYKNLIEKKGHYKEVPSTIIPSLLRFFTGICTLKIFSNL